MDKIHGSTQFLLCFVTIATFNKHFIYLSTKFRKCQFLQKAPIQLSLMKITTTRQQKKKTMKLQENIAVGLQVVLQFGTLSKVLQKGEMRK